MATWQHRPQTLPPAPAGPPTATWQHRPQTLPPAPAGPPTATWQHRPQTRTVPKREPPHVGFARQPRRPHDAQQAARNPPQPLPPTISCRPKGRHRPVTPNPQNRQRTPPPEGQGAKRWGLAARSSDRTLQPRRSARSFTRHLRPTADRMLEHGQPPSRSPVQLKESLLLNKAQQAHRAQPSSTKLNQAQPSSTKLNQAQPSSTKHPNYDRIRPSSGFPRAFAFTINRSGAPRNPYRARSWFTKNLRYDAARYFGRLHHTTKVGGRTPPWVM